MSNKSFFGFTGLFGAVVVALALICASCSSPVAPQRDTVIVTVKINVQKFSYVDFYAFRIGQDSAYKTIFSGQNRDTCLTLKKTDMLLINAHVVYGDFPEKFSLTVDNDTTLLF
jgi:hypothetical protein